MKFQFKAITISGNQQEGKIEATTQEKAIEMLQRHKLVIVSIKPIREFISITKMFSFLHRVKREKIIMFSKELAVMLESGIPLVEARTRPFGLLRRAVITRGFGACIRRTPRSTASRGVSHTAIPFVVSRTSF